MRSHTYRFVSFSSDSAFVMDLLDNPSFSMDFPEDYRRSEDSAAPPSGFSSSGESVTHQCAKCHMRMSRLSVDRHSCCIKCRGMDSDLDNRCDDCLHWSKEEMLNYLKNRKSLATKSRSKAKV